MGWRVKSAMTVKNKGVGEESQFYIMESNGSSEKNIYFWALSAHDGEASQISKNKNAINIWKI
jgi:hypothetical protein